LQKEKEKIGKTGRKSEKRVWSLLVIDNIQIEKHTT